jgi:hypothetical protein
MQRMPRGVGGLLLVALFAVGILLAVGRLSRAQLAPSNSRSPSSARGALASPTRPGPDVPHLAFQEPINALAGVLRIDPDNAKVLARIPVMTEAPVAVGADAVWVACCGPETSGSDGRLRRIDPATNRIVATIRLHGLPDAVGAGISGVWVRGALGPVWHIDPATNRVVGRVRVPGGLGGQWGSVLVGGDTVWVSDPSFGRVMQINPATQRLAGDRLRARWRDLGETADGTVWSGGVALRPGKLSRVATLPGRYGSDVVALATGPATVWIATDIAVLARLDPRPAP